MKNDLNAEAVARDAIALAEMDEGDFSSLLVELEKLPLLLDTADDAYSVLRNKEQLDGDDVAPGDFLLYAIYEIANRGDKSTLRLFEGLIGNVKRKLLADGADKELATILAERLEKLSQLRNVITSVKASFLLEERERLLISSRVVSDVRPVFDDGLTSTSLLLLNTLVLEYREDEKKNVVHIALDANDIDSLIIQLERAKRKMESLKTMFSLSNISVIE